MAALPPDCDVDFEAEMRGYDFTALDPQHLYHQTGVQQPVLSARSLSELLIDPCLLSTGTTTTLSVPSLARSPGS